MRPRSVAILILALMLLAVPVKAAPPCFPTPREAVDRLVTLGVIRGVMPGESIDINVSGYVTRAELATVIVRAFGREEAALSAPLIEPPYADVPLDAWYAKYLAEARLLAGDAGVALGDGTGRFDPNRSLSRVEALILPLKLIGQRPAEPGPSWYSPWIDLAYQKGLLTPDEAACLKENPHQPSTRGEAFVLLDRLFYARLLPDGQSVYTKYVDPVPPTIEVSARDGARTEPETVLPGPLAAAFPRAGAPGQPIPLTAVDAKGNPLSAVRWEAVTPGAEIDPAGFFRAQSPGSYQVRVSQPGAKEQLVTFKVLDPKEELTPEPVGVWQEGESWVMALGLFREGERVAPISSTHPSEIIPPKPMRVTASKSLTLTGGVDSVGPTGGLYLVRYTIDPAHDSPVLEVRRPGGPSQVIDPSQLRPSAPPGRALLSHAQMWQESYSRVGSPRRIQGTVQVLVTDSENQPVAGVDVVVEAEGEGILLQGSRMRVYRTDESGLATVSFETGEGYTYGRLRLRSAFLGTEPVAISNAIMQTAHE